MAWVRVPRAWSSGTTPEVETVIRRREMAIPSPSDRMSMASATLSRLYSGSPMPMNTTLDRRRSCLGEGHSSRSSRAICTWATISAAVRLRTKGWVPVWQKVQFKVQPTWLETHSAPPLRAWATSGMNTVSASTPGAKRISHFRVPSSEIWRSTTSGRAMTKCSARSAWVSLATLLMRSKPVTP